MRYWNDQVTPFTHKTTLYIFKAYLTDVVVLVG